MKLRTLFESKLLQNNRPSWLSIRSVSLSEAMGRRPNLVKALKNTIWLFSDRIGRMVVGIVVMAFVARYLGPGQFGQLNYALALVGMFGTFAVLGLNSVVVRRLILEPESSPETLGSAFALQFMASAVAVSMVMILVWTASPDDSMAKLIVAILGLRLLFKPAETIKYWFESQVLSKYTVIAEFGIFALLSIMKLILVFSGAPLVAFAIILVLEAGCNAGALVLICNSKNQNVFGWRYVKPVARELLSSAWPLLLTSIFVTINLNADKVILMHFQPASEVGLYAAANALTAAWLFVPVALGGSVSPHLTKLYVNDLSSYTKYTRKLYFYFIAGSAFVALLISASSEMLIAGLYGEDFAGTSGILSVIIWSITFISCVSLRGRLLVIEGRQNKIAVLVFFGAITNIFLALWLTPTYGAIGAAYAFTLSWAASALVFPFAMTETRGHGRMAFGLRPKENL